MKNPEDLTDDELLYLAVQVRNALYATPYLDARGEPKVSLARNKVWDADTLQAIDEAMVMVGLSPDDPEDA